MIIGSGKQSRRSSLANISPDSLKSVIDEYSEFFDANAELRKDSYQTLVDNYYNLTTDFYQFGWGNSFHFASRKRGEGFKASLLRHEHFLADRMSLQPGMKVLDVGCGVGGPMLNLARYSGASFVGLNSNAYQIKCAKSNIRDDVESLCSFIEADFMQIPANDGSYDGAIAIESMPHAPNRADAFREIRRILRPGSLFACYEWCLTDLFDPGNDEHLSIKKNIELGNGLPDLASIVEVRAALHEVGFEIVEDRDVALDSDPGMPWYRALQGRDFSIASIARIPVGRAVTNFVLGIGEKIRVVPPGIRKVSTILNIGADTLVRGGQSGIFTPMFYFLARKPLEFEE